MKSNTRSIAALLTAIPMSLLSLTSLAQTENLVSNGSFESTSGKVKKLGAIEMATDWVSPTGVRADLYAPASKIPEISTPTNAYGMEEPKEGNNYAGIYAFSYNDKLPRSYVMAKLTTPLKKGMTYCVSFNVSLAELSKYASNQVSALVSKKSYSTEEKVSIIETSQIIHPDNKIFNAMYNWEKVCGTFVAEGGEKYITIGNFATNENTKYEKNKQPAGIKGTPIIAAYYYIDDVSVIMLDNGKTCDCGLPEAEDEQLSTTIYSKAVVLNDKMTTNQKIEAQAAYFAFGKDRLQPSAMSSLDFIVAQLKANPAMKLEISGHSDTKEDELGKTKPMYADMARKRVDIVVAYLKEKGISESRLIPVIKGSSESNPEITATDDEELQLAKNRRVVFKVK